MSLPPPVLALSLVHCNTSCRLCFMKHCLFGHRLAFLTVLRFYVKPGRTLARITFSHPPACPGASAAQQRCWASCPSASPLKHSRALAVQAKNGGAASSKAAAQHLTFLSFLRGKAAEAYGGCSGALPQQGPAGLFASPPAGAGGEAERGRPRVRSRLLLLQTAAPKAKSRDVDFSKAGRGF